MIYDISKQKSPTETSQEKYQQANIKQKLWINFFPVHIKVLQELCLSAFKGFDVVVTNFQAFKEIPCKANNGWPLNAHNTYSLQYWVVCNAAT